ncbi:hypothetical protein Tco_0396402 [Tanacetum coccineum]
MEGGSYWLDKVQTSIWRDVKTLAIEEAYTTKYSIHPGADTMLCGFKIVREILRSFDWIFLEAKLQIPCFCDDIHDVTPRVSALAGCDRLVSEPMVMRLVPLSYGSVDVVVGENWMLRHKAEMDLVGFTPRRRIGFRMKLVQGTMPICEGSCRLTFLERQRGVDDCKELTTVRGWFEWMRNGHVEVTAMPFGLTNAPAVFMELMSRVLMKDYMANVVGLIMRGIDDGWILFSEFDFEAKYHLGKANVDVVPWSRKKE